jgi:hypothetical protein
MVRDAAIVPSTFVEEFNSASEAVTPNSAEPLSFNERRESAHRLKDSSPWVDKNAGSLWDYLLMLMFKKRQTTEEDGASLRIRASSQIEYGNRRLSVVEMIVKEEEAAEAAMGKEVQSAKIQAGIHFSKGRWHCCLTIDPRTDWMKVWDGLIIILLIFTTYVTPYEVAFLSTRLNPLFFINRFVDLVFLLDLIRSFFTAYFDEEKQYWVGDVTTIVYHYMRGWFVIDLVSILPFDSVGLILQSEVMTKFKAARIIRLLRLLKLLRLLRSARIINRWRDEYGECCSQREAAPGV